MASCLLDLLSIVDLRAIVSKNGRSLRGGQQCFIGVVWCGVSGGANHFAAIILHIFSVERQWWQQE